MLNPKIAVERGNWLERTCAPNNCFAVTRTLHKSITVHCDALNLTRMHAVELRFTCREARFLWVMNDKTSFPITNNNSRAVQLGKCRMLLIVIPLTNCLIIWRSACVQCPDLLMPRSRRPPEPILWPNRCHWWKFAVTRTSCAARENDPLGVQNHFSCEFYHEPSHVLAQRSRLSAPCLAKVFNARMHTLDVIPMIEKRSSRIQTYCFNGFRAMSWTTGFPDSR